jgi:hypothetical protein
MHGFEQYVGTQYVLIKWCCMYLFCGIAFGTEATGGARYSNLALTISQNKYKKLWKTHGMGSNLHRHIVGTK